MKKNVFMITMILMLMLAACGGGAAEPAAPAADTTSETAVTTSEEPAAPAAEEVTAEEPAAPESDTAEEPAATEAPAEEAPAAEEAASSDYLFEGTDPETGLEINPTSVAPGDTFIVRGKITSMNLTPQTSPEFLIQAPNGTRYRMGSQAISETFVEDGSQLQAFQFKIGMWAEATVTLAADAGPSDIYSTTDLTILLYEE